MDKRTKQERLKEARIAAGYGSAAEAAKALGVGVSTYTSHENNTRDFDNELALKYARRFKVTPEWIVFGVRVAHQDMPPDAMAGNVREIDFRAGAGGGGVEMIPNATTQNGITVSEDVVRDRWSLPDSFLRGELRVDSRAAFIAEIYGDSGYNPDNPHAPGSLHPGDRVIIDTLDRRPSPPGLFAVFDGSGLVVKMVDLVRGAEPARIRLSSRNPSYEPYEVVEDEGFIVGRVRGRISAM
jgi:phage repressor protein C with HTH and peptisase S24 domain